MVLKSILPGLLHGLLGQFSREEVRSYFIRNKVEAASTFEL